MLSLEQKYKALLVLASWNYGMDHFLENMNEPNFLTPEWLARYWDIPSNVRIDLIEIAEYRPEWFSKK